MEISADDTYMSTPTADCQGRVFLREVQKPGNNQGKKFFTCEHTNGSFMWESQFKPGMVLKCKHAQALALAQSGFGSSEQTQTQAPAEEGGVDKAELMEMLVELEEALIRSMEKSLKEATEEILEELRKEKVVETVEQEENKTPPLTPPKPSVKKPRTPYARKTGNDKK